VHQAGRPVAGLIARAGRLSTRTLICTDADLGGVRIAARILGRVPSAEDVDVGVIARQPGRMFSAHTRTRLSALATTDDRIGAFARGCLERGYAVGQEANVRAAVLGALR